MLHSLTMVIVPKEKPVIDNLNSYYVDIGKLFEHFQGELGTGGVYFRSKEREAMIYFDATEWLNGVYDRQGSVLVGHPAREGVIALQLHSGGEGRMRFKDLWIRDLSR